ncbi:hypothetical protein PHLCEN_2v5292 [Hermanssonia centrifuga]|uniref:BTB domain-containing protein n=1 Tax=Hermanssonia centrifuga TaxID=98765 RepID=A0A2R6P8J8_9APHY|nr:hypothetical protein PHLCEN_2v5292 [Hermanssonia centrifuga]
MSLSPKTTAKAPFDNVKADVILCTSDDVQFYVWAIILAEASHVFRDMFSLPQPTTSSGTPIIVLSEDSETLDVLLRLCYPVRDPSLTDLTMLGKVWEAARKYELDEGAEIIANAVRSFLSTRPLHVFAIACGLGVEEESRLAAEAWKASETFKSISSLEDPDTFERTIAGASYIPEMANLPSGAFYRLLSFLRSSPDSDISLCGTPTQHYPSPDDIKTPLVFDVPCPADVDVVIRASDGMDFPVHSLILRSASAEGLLDYSKTRTKVRAGSLPIVQVQAPSDILVELLRLCYPMNSPTIDDCSKIRQMLRFASLHKMTKVTEVLKKRVADILQVYPVRHFFIAIEQGWKDVAQDAARNAAKHPIDDVYTLEMEDIPAAVYYSLLQYHRFYTTTVADVSSRHINQPWRWEVTTRMSKLGLARLIAISKSLTPIPSIVVVDALQKAFTADEETSASKAPINLSRLITAGEEIITEIERETSRVVGTWLD